MTTFRVTQTSYFNTLNYNLTNQQLAYQKAAIPTYTGKKINNLSDDSSAINKLFSLKDDIAQNENFTRNVNDVNDRLNFSQSQMMEGLDVLARIREKILQANDPTLNTSNYTDIAAQVSDLKEAILSVGNASYNNNYIFSGTKITTQPFTGTPTVYNGNNDVFSLQISRNISLEVNLDGEQIFMGDGGGVDVFDTIDDLVTAIGTGNQDDMDTGLGLIDDAMDQLREGLSTIGTRLQRVDSIKQKLADEKVVTLEALSNVQDADTSESITNLVTRETALKMVFSSSSRVLEVLSGLTIGQ